MFFKAFKILSGLFFIYLLAGIFLLPLLLKQELPQLIQNNTNLELEVDDVLFNPLTFVLSFNDIILKDLHKSPIISCAQMRVDFTLIDSVIDSIVHLNISLEQLEINSPQETKPILKLETLMLRNVDIQAIKKDVKIDKIMLHKLKMYIKKEIGSYNFTKLLELKLVDSKEKSTKNPNQNSFHLHFEELSIENSQLVFDDKSLHRESHQSLENLRIVIKDFDTNKSSAMKYTLEGLINSKGTIVLDGVVSLDPFTQNGSYSMRDVNLSSLSSYLEEKMYINLHSALLSLSGRSSYIKMKTRDTLIVDMNAELDDVILIDTRVNEKLFSLKSLRVEDIHYQHSNNRLSTKNIRVDDFFINSKINKIGTFNFATLVKGNGAKHKEIQREDNPMSFAIKTIAISDGKVNFEDNSLEKVYRTRVDDINISVADLSSSRQNKSKIKMQAKINKSGALRVQGDINIKDPSSFTDVTIDVKGIDMHSLSEYSRSISGYDIEAGKLYLALDYKINKGKLLGVNRVVLSKPKLGKIDVSKKFTPLPLGFVLDLLKDNEGVVRVDFPIEGDINDPTFKYSQVLLKTLRDLVLNIASSPGNFLGGLVGFSFGDSEEIVFKSGLSQLETSERKKLDLIAKKLFEHPNVNLCFTAKLYANELKENSNRNLSEHRVTTIINYLVNEKFINNKRLRRSKIIEEKKKLRDNVKEKVDITIDIPTE